MPTCASELSGCEAASSVTKQALCDAWEPLPVCDGGGVDLQLRTHPSAESVADSLEELGEELADEDEDEDD